MNEKIIRFLGLLAGFENDRVPWIIELVINFIGVILIIVLMFCFILYILFQYIIFFLPFILIMLLTPRYKLEGNNRAARFCKYYINLRENVFSNE